MAERQTSEQRQFSLHPHIIFDVISSQAGSRGKGYLELVMNAIDARASQFAIDITADGYVARDDGAGFRDYQAITTFFEQFGCPRSDGDRIVGQFGMGRGQ